MKKVAVLVLLLAAGYVYTNRDRALPEIGGDHSAATSSSDEVLARAFEERRSNLQVEGSGEVIRVLSDDSAGDRHQRMIIRLSSGQTLLISHNIDLAPRVATVAAGDTVDFYGEYEWNDQGGVIHWTHHDPDGSHVAGWIRHEGKTYQ